MKESDGVIIKSNYGCYNFSDREPEDPYLELEIQIFDGYLTTMTFDSSCVKIILQRLLPNYVHQTVADLVGCKVRLLDFEDTRAPVAIGGDSEPWIYKRNWANE